MNAVRTVRCTHAACLKYFLVEPGTSGSAPCLLCRTPVPLGPVAAPRPAPEPVALPEESFTLEPSAPLPAPTPVAEGGRKVAALKVVARPQSDDALLGLE